LLHKIWEILEGEKRNGVSPENLKNFTAAIMKISLILETLPESKSKYGDFDEKGNFIFNDTQAMRIHKDFIFMYLNRSTAVKDKRKMSQHAAPEQEYSFKPELCEKSKEIQTKNENIKNRVDLLIKTKQEHEEYFL